MGKLFNIDNYKKNKTVFVNKAQTHAEITLYGEIGASFWSEGHTGDSISKELKNMPSSVKEITVRINSGGGSVFEGMTIYELLKQHKAKVTVYVDGLSASIASVIMLAGDEIVMGEGALVMIHKPLVGVYGNAEELERMINILDKIEDQMIRIYMKKTKKSYAEIANYLSKETWFKADEAVDFGIADRIVEDGEQVYAVASILKDSPWIKTRPEASIKKSDDLIKSKLSNIKNDLEGFLARK